MSRKLTATTSKVTTAAEAHRVAIGIAKEVEQLLLLVESGGIVALGTLTLIERAMTKVSDLNRQNRADRAKVNAGK